MVALRSIWERAIVIGLSKYIVAQDDDDDDGEVDDEDGDGIPDEVEEVFATMSEPDNRNLFFTIFDMYVALGDDLTSMDFNEFCELVRDFELCSPKFKHCKSVDIDRIFIAVDTASKMYDKKNPKPDKEGGQTERTKSLSIAEFLYAIVRIAAARFIQSGKEKDVSTAVNTLLNQVIKPRAEEQTKGNDQTTYRNKECYIEEIDKVLRKHEKSMRNLFRAIATQDKAMPRAVRKDVGPIVTYSTWKVLVKSLGLLGTDVSDREANQCFVGSRMMVLEPYTDRGAYKSTGLPFEGFMEALVRLAGIKGRCRGIEPATKI